MVTQHLVKLSVTLRPVDQPNVKVGVNGDMLTVVLDKTETMDFEFTSGKDCQLTVELVNKKDQEAVVVESVSFFGIQDPRFAWAGVYEPQYPEPWATQQHDQGVVLKQHLSPHTYLSWPGKWTLTFDVPVFTWIHRVQNLGWIYG
jgi:hypothetical protein